MAIGTGTQLSPLPGVIANQQATEAGWAALKPNEYLSILCKEELQQEWLRKANTHPQHTLPSPMINHLMCIQLSAPNQAEEALELGFVLPTEQGTSSKKDRLTWLRYLTRSMIWFMELNLQARVKYCLLANFGDPPPPPQPAWWFLRAPFLNGDVSPNIVQGAWCLLAAVNLTRWHSVQPWLAQACFVALAHAALPAGERLFIPLLDVYPALSAEMVPLTQYLNPAYFDLNLVFFNLAWKHMPTQLKVSLCSRKDLHAAFCSSKIYFKTALEVKPIQLSQAAKPCFILGSCQWLILQI